jgi:hypothetical protein
MPEAHVVVFVDRGEHDPSLLRMCVEIHDVHTLEFKQVLQFAGQVSHLPVAEFPKKLTGHSFTQFPFSSNRPPGHKAPLLKIQTP